MSNGLTNQEICAIYRNKIVSYTHFFAEYNAGCVMSAVLQVPKEQNGCDDDTVVLLFFVFLRKEERPMARIEGRMMNLL